MTQAFVHGPTACCSPQGSAVGGALSFTPTPAGTITVAWPVPAEAVQPLRDGRLAIVLHTNMNPTCDIRGQIRPLGTADCTCP